MNITLSSESLIIIIIVIIITQNSSNSFILPATFLKPHASQPLTFTSFVSFFTCQFVIFIIITFTIDYSFIPGSKLAIHCWTVFMDLLSVILF